MIRALLVLGAVLASTAPTWAAPDDGVVVIADGASDEDLATLGKRLDGLGAAHPLPPGLARALAGQVAYDLAPIRDAYASFDFERADELIEAALGDLFTTGTAEQLAPGVAELLYWRGLVSANDNRAEDASGWFVAVFRIAPDFEVDNATASPTVRKLIASAKRPSNTTRALTLRGDVPAEAELAIDGGPPRAFGDRVELTLGLHLLTVTAPGRSPYATLVEVRAGRDEPLTVVLEDEGVVEEARRARAEVLAAEAGERIKRLRGLRKLTGARRFLVIDDGRPPTVRLYELGRERVSSAAPLEDALRADVLSGLLDERGGSRGPTPWYRRWYVWAAAGAVVTGAAVGAYAYSQRDATHIVGF